MSKVPVYDLVIVTHQRAKTISDELANYAESVTKVIMDGHSACLICGVHLLIDGPSSTTNVAAVAFVKKDGVLKQGDVFIGCGVCAECAAQDNFERRCAESYIARAGLDMPEVLE
jgi:hypothetical protein